MVAAERTRSVVRYDGVAIDVISQGRGPVVLLAPSLGRGAEDFDAVAAELAARGFRVLRPQPRGAGASAGPMTGLSYRDWAADLAAVIAAERAGPAVLVGHAAGSRYARAAAAYHPELVRGVVVAAASADRPPPADLAAALTDSADACLADDRRLAALRVAFFATGSDPSPWLRGWFPTTHRAQRASVESDGWHSGGRVPLLDLIAGRDPWRPPATWSELQETLGDRVSTAVIPQAAHALFPERPRQVVQAVAAWIRTL
ncbi:alpha/beta hydrolase [Nonomuraea sp. NPDC026600]|uniref:alpha/beta fold hydrolase n=1 Tax=Nonomuraea sp. NPDC026600 TaxID=3155363 RepID=UPI0033F24AE0